MMEEEIIWILGVVLAVVFILIFISYIKDYRKVKISVIKSKSEIRQDGFIYKVIFEYKGEVLVKKYLSFDELEENVCKERQDFVNIVDNKTEEDLKLKEILKRC